MITISPENMTVAEKLSAMEVIWNDLCQHTLPKGNVLIGVENTHPFECDGLSVC